jgi:hypothetical protein
MASHNQSSTRMLTVATKVALLAPLFAIYGAWSGRSDWLEPL